jgi:hypothetical protein
VSRARLSVLLAALALAPGAVLAGEPLSVTFPAARDQVLRATVEVLEREGWGVDDVAGPVGLVTTKSQRIQGDFDPIASKTRRVRLRVQITPLDDERTAVTIERQQFTRDKLLFLERDEFVPGFDPLAAPDHRVERALLSAIRRAL